MIERSVQHEVGRFSRCRTCHAEPKHYRVCGRRSNEPVLFAICPDRHRLACRCGARTAAHDTLERAERSWGTDYAQLALPLHSRRRKRAAA